MTVAASTALDVRKLGCVEGRCREICRLCCDLDRAHLLQLGAAPGMPPRFNEPRGPRDRNEARVRQLDNCLGCGLPLARGAARARSPPRVGWVPLGKEARPVAPQMGCQASGAGLRGDAVAAGRGAF